MSRASDAARPEAEDTLGRVGQSAAAGFDGTHRSDNGSPAHVNVAQSGNRMAIGIGGSRATLTPDAMDGFGGIAITDGYGAYGRFDAGGRHRACRAHHLRETKHPAGRHGGAVPPGARRVRREPREDRRPAFRTAKMPAAQRGRALAAPTGRDEPRDAGHDGRVPRQGKGRSRHD